MNMMKDKREYAHDVADVEVEVLNLCVGLKSISFLYMSLGFFEFLKMKIKRVWEIVFMVIKDED